MKKEYLEQKYSLSSYNENTKDQLDYYLDESACEKGDTAYLYSHEKDELRQLKIVKIIRRSNDPDMYDHLVESGDVLLDGEDKYGADTGAEFVTDNDCYLVWFRYA